MFKRIIFGWLNVPYVVSGHYRGKYITILVKEDVGKLTLRTLPKMNNSTYTNEINQKSAMSLADTMGLNYVETKPHEFAELIKLTEL